MCPRKNPDASRRGRPRVGASRPLLPIACALVAACYSPIKEPVERTALHQQVTTAAVDSAIAALDLSSLDRNAVYAVDVAAPRATDQSWIEAALRARLRTAGLRVSARPGVATRRIQVLVPYAGSDLESTLIGIPVFVPGLPFSFGDISLYKSSTLTGRAALRPQVTASRPPGDARPSAAAPAPEDVDAEELVVALHETRASRYFQNLTFFTFIGPFIRTDLDGLETFSGDEEERSGERFAPRRVEGDPEEIR